MKKTLLLLTVLSLIVCYNLQAQFIKEYNKLPGYNVRFAAIIPVTNDDATNLYITGNYSTYLFVGEFLQNGDPVWSRKINLGDTSATINQMIKDSDGNLVIVGTFINGDFGKAFAVKYNPFNKKVIWYQKANTNSFFWDVAEMGAGGNYVLGGQETGTGTGNQTDDITVIADRNTGAMTVISSLNKHINESIEALVYDADSAAIYTTGRYELLSGASKFRICMSKMNTSGVVEWTRSYIESTSTAGRYYSEDLLRDGDTLIIVGAGDDNGTNSVRYLWLIKTDIEGNGLLTNKYDITGVTNDGLFSSIKRHENGYIVYGTLHNGTNFSDIFLFNIDFSGNIVWSKSYPFSTRTPTTGLFNAGSMAIVGNNIFQVGEKRQPDGSIKGVLMQTSLASGEVNSCTNDVSCTVTTLLDNYDANATLNVESSAVLFTSSLPTKSKHTFNIVETCNVNGLTTPEEQESELIEEELIWRHENLTQEIEVFPNPTTGIVTVENPFGENELAEYVIYDNSGNILSHGSFSKLSANIDVSNFASGLYFIVVTDNQKVEKFTLKIVKQ